MNDLQIDLKVCEGCGALWLRRTLSGEVYCRGCKQKLADFPAPRGRRAPQRRTRVRCADVDHQRTFRLVQGGAR